MPQHIRVLLLDSFLTKMFFAASSEETPKSRFKATGERANTLFLFVSPILFLVGWLLYFYGKAKHER